MEFELEIIRWLQKLSSPFLDTISIIGSHLFSYGFAVILAISIFLFYNKKFALTYSSIMVIAVLLNFLIKILIARHRPFEVGIYILNIYESAGYSYPSGHSVSAMGVALAVGFVFRDDLGTKRGHIMLVVLTAFLLLNMLNRMYLGQHYLTDILAGYALMFGVCWLAYSLFPKLFKVNHNPLLRLKKNTDKNK